MKELALFIVEDVKALAEPLMAAIIVAITYMGYTVYFGG